jgi:AcrR family transcriptional regulator
MMDTKQKIARNLDRQFAEMGFATQGVEALREGADVSLRTLYKYFPSREDMVVGALKYRDGIYFDWIAGGPGDGAEHALYPIARLGDWLEEVANTGCLFMNALAAYPESQAVRKAVLAHKSRLADVFRERLQKIAPDRETEHLVQSLFLLHEGLTEAARLQGPKRAMAAALRAARALLAAEGLL